MLTLGFESVLLLPLFAHIKDFNPQHLPENAHIRIRIHNFFCQKMLTLDLNQQLFLPENAPVWILQTSEISTFWTKIGLST